MNMNIFSGSKQKQGVSIITTVYGWVRSARVQNDICFFQINDGSTAKELQLICEKHKNEEIYEQCKHITTGSYMSVRGVIIESPSLQQCEELIIQEILYIGNCEAKSYPIKKNMKLEGLREVAHFRPRTRIYGAIYRIRNTLMYETHNFFQNHKFLNLDPNIITINECEGGAGVFCVTELLGKQTTTREIPNKSGVINYNKDHFKKQAYLTVSSQLQLEALACGMGNVYTMNKSFRSEHSNTNKHVSEFTHLEIEMIELGNQDLMDIGQLYIETMIKKVYEKNYTDIVELDKFVYNGSGELLDRFENKMLKLQFTRITYTDAIEYLQTKNYDVKLGDDLSSEMEEALTELCEGAVFVYDWDFGIKSFYMKQKEGGLCENFDLLMPFGIGELIGGSMREEKYDVLVDAMKKKQVDTKGLEWYLDLRKYGTVQHGGFGLGMDRLLMMLTGMKNIKDVIPFPVYYQNCSF